MTIPKMHEITIRSDQTVIYIKLATNTKQNTLYIQKTKQPEPIGNSPGYQSLPSFLPSKRASESSSTKTTKEKWYQIPLPPLPIDSQPASQMSEIR
jgi:hypothetical protein